MLKTSFNAGWIYHDGGGGALDALIHGGQDNGKPVTLPHDASVARPRDSREPNGSGNGFLWKRIVIIPRNFWWMRRTRVKMCGWNLKGFIRMHLSISIIPMRDSVPMATAIFILMPPNLSGSVKKPGEGSGQKRSAQRTLVYRRRDLQGC